VRHPRKVFRIVEAHRGVLQGELTHLTFEPCAIHGHGTIPGK